MGIIQRLSDLRNEAGMTQSKLAEELGVTQQAVNTYENSDKDIMTSTILRIADYFDVSVDYLMGVSESKDILEPRSNDECYKRIGDIRRLKRLSQKQMAELLGVSQQQVGRFESGKYDLSGKRFLQIAEVCDVSLDYLAGRTIDSSRR